MGTPQSEPPPAPALKVAGESPRPPAEAEPEAPALQVVVVDRAPDLQPYLDRWTLLATEAAEANIFYEPGFLLPALKAFALQTPLAIVLVLGHPPGPPRKNAIPELWGFFPLEKRPRGAGGVPLPHLRLWMHDYSYVPTPLVHRAHAPAVMTAFFDWLVGQGHTPPLLAIDKLPVGGPFHQQLVDEIGRRQATAFARDRYTRALLAPDCDAETYQARAIAGKHRKEVRRQRKRLGELGTLTIVEMGPQDDFDTWMAEFLALEASGWKGREGSALGSQQPDALFFHEMTRACHRAGRLAATAVRLDGKALAMQLLLLSGAGAFAFKIGYDEAYARYSPGVLLELDLVERVAEAGGGRSPLRWIDSAADRNHPMINRLWTERRSIESLLVAADPTTSLVLSLLPAVRWVRRMLTSSGLTSLKNLTGRAGGRE